MDQIANLLQQVNDVRRGGVACTLLVFPAASAVASENPGSAAFGEPIPNEL